MLSEYRNNTTGINVTINSDIKWLLEIDNKYMYKR